MDDHMAYKIVKAIEEQNRLLARLVARFCPPECGPLPPSSRERQLACTCGTSAVCPVHGGEAR